VITPEQAIEAFNARFGRHPGYRALHAKGSFCHATFAPTPDAARLTHAAHMQGPEIDATVRFSNGSGDPSQPDNVADVRGMAVTFHLPDGSRTDISAQSVPRFPVSTPEALVELIRASGRNAASLWRFGLFLARHPRIMPTLGANADALRPPSSYASIPYFAVHAFKWVGPSGGERYVRYRWDPEETAPRLAKFEARQRGPDYLQEELRERLSDRPANFSLMVQLAAEADPVDDPAAMWPEDRETVNAGTLKVTGVMTFDEAHTPLVFDPMRLTDGIEASNDPVLRFRPRAYAVSAQRRGGRG
jgi:catalase